MRVKKYTRGFSRRQFIKTLGVAGASTGVLSPLWSVLAEDGDHTRAYPEELLFSMLILVGKYPILGLSTQITLISSKIYSIQFNIFR